MTCNLIKEAEVKGDGLNKHVSRTMLHVLYFMYHVHYVNGLLGQVPKFVCLKEWKIRDQPRVFALYQKVYYRNQRSKTSEKASKNLTSSS